MARARTLAIATATGLALTFAPALIGAGPVNAAPPQRASRDSGPAVSYDSSPALRDLSSAPDGEDPKHAHKHEHFDKREAHHFTSPQSGTADPVAQTAPVAAAAPATSASFDGVGQGFTGPQGTWTVNVAPPDTVSAVGPNHIVEAVNSGFAIFNKSGTVLYGPVNTNTLWSGFGGPCQTTNDGDAVVNYDRAADRWVISQFANAASASGPYYECLAVSQTADPTGAYYRYAFSYSNFPDYPKVGVWPDAYYVTYNLFQGNTYKGAEACAMDRAKMLSGLAATQQCFTTSTAYGGLLPASNDGATAPPAGAPELFTALGTTSTSLAYWKMHVDWATPANTTFTGPSTLTVASYSAACGGGTCVPQPGTTNKLDSLADRLMFRLAYRNFGDHESYVLTHSVTSGTSTGIRWYELRTSGGNPTVYQQGTYAPDSAYRWMGSAAMDGSGGIALGYSVSSSTVSPGIRYAGRAAGDALGTLTTGEGTIVNGGGSQTGTLTRWGDYAAMTVDPVDDCTFWFSSEYLASSGSFNWHTRLGSFKLASCGGTVPSNDFSMSLSPTSGAVTAGGSATATVSTAVTSGAAQTVSLSASGLPSGATATFTPSSVTAGSSSTMSIATSTSTPAGTYTVTVTGTGTSATHTATYSLTVSAPSSCTPGQLLGNPGFETGSPAPWSATAGVVTNSASEPAHSGTWKAWLDGYGTTHTDWVKQAVALPTGCSSYAFSFWLHIDTAETTSTTAYDTLKVQVLNSSGTVLATLATYSNLNAAAGYTQRSFSLAGYAGQTVTLRFLGVEDSSLQTSFVVDDAAVNVS